MASLRQFTEAPDTGKQMEVTVNRFNADDGLYEVTVPGASMQVEDWSDVAEGIVVEAQLITGNNSGGLECTVGHLPEDSFRPARFRCTVSKISRSSRTRSCSAW